MEQPTITFNSLSFSARVYRAASDDFGKPTHKLIQGQRLFVQARRPGMLRIEDVTTEADIDPHEPISMNPFNLFVSDGTHQLELDKVFRVYVSSEAARDLSKVNSKYRLTTFIAPDLLFAHDLSALCPEIHKESVDNTPALIYTRIVQVGEHVYHQQLAVSATNGLPLRMAKFIQDDAGKWIEVLRTDFSDWKIDPDLPVATFDPTPPADAKVDTGRFVSHEANIALGDQPKPLNVVGIDGKKITLKQYQGKVLLLDYWALWCRPCRAELPHILGMYERFHAQGLEVVGISLDYAEERNRLTEFLSKHQIRWQQIHDGKMFDSPFVKAYKVNAIPFTLLIGRNGKIAAVNLSGDDLRDAIQHELHKHR